MRVFISGKITNCTNYQEKFYEAQRLIEDSGNIVVNPIEICSDIAVGSKWEVYMGRCVKHLISCDAILLLDNYNDSLGSKVEYNIAKEIGLNILNKGE